MNVWVFWYEIVKSWFWWWIRAMNLVGFWELGVLVVRCGEVCMRFLVEWIRTILYFIKLLFLYDTVFFYMPIKWQNFINGPRGAKKPATLINLTPYYGLTIERHLSSMCKLPRSRYPLFVQPRLILHPTIKSNPTVLDQSDNSIPIVKSNRHNPLSIYTTITTIILITTTLVHHNHHPY